jgi:tight adherence protein C
MIVVLACVVVFAAIFFLVLGLSSSSANPMSDRLANMLSGERLFVGPTGPQQGSITSRVFFPMFDSIGGKLEALLPTRWVQGIEKRLIRAGQPTTTNGFLIAMLLVEGALLSFAFLLITSGKLGALGMILLPVCAVFGVLLPKIWLDNQVRYRQKVILKSLPDAFDLITTCVEAGLGLDAALARVAEKVAGPFGEELAIALREVSLGKLRRDALRELAERTGVPDLTSFINAVVQAETMGTSIAMVLRVQAEQMRTKRRQRAEQQAQQAPVKMMFPLILCIFPSLFIVILGPAGISIYQQLIAKQ